MKRLVTFLGSLLLWASPAVAADPRWLPIETSPWWGWGNSSWNAQSLNATTNWVELMFTCKEACAIDTLCYRQDTTTLTPPANAYKVSLEGVSTSTGRADGTVKSSTNATKNFTPAAATDGQIVCQALTASYTCTRGEVLAETIRYNTGTVTANFTSFDYNNNNMPGSFVPYAYNVVTSVGTADSGLIPYGYKCGSAVYGMPVETLSNQTFGSDSTPDERGNVFTEPSGSCSTFKVGGVRFQGQLTCSTNTAKLILYSGTTALQTLTVQCAQQKDNAGGGVAWYEYYFSDSSLTALTCGTNYRIALQPQTTGGSQVGLNYFTVHAAGDMDAFPLGTAMYGTSRTDAGAWTDDTLRRYAIEPILQDITAGSGTISRKDMNGGLQ